MVEAAFADTSSFTNIIDRDVAVTARPNEVERSVKQFLTGRRLFIHE
jgi:hypothetical protein